MMASVISRRTAAMDKVRMRRMDDYRRYGNPGFAALIRGFIETPFQGSVLNKDEPRRGVLIKPRSSLRDRGVGDLVPV